MPTRRPSRIPARHECPKSPMVVTEETLGCKTFREDPTRGMIMRALTVVPLSKDSLEVSEVADPVAGDGELLVEGLALGVCGTDREIAGGQYGWAPKGEERLILGHESLGRVREAPEGSGFSPGDLVVGIVRRPDPVPCGACAAGEWDMCRTDGFGERGIVRLHGYGSERWRIEPDFAVPILPRLGELG